MEKIEKMIKAYNKKAEKWGYETVNVENGKTMEKFVGKPLDGLSFFKKIKVAYQNGYLNEDYDKIKKELDK